MVNLVLKYHVCLILKQGLSIILAGFKLCFTLPPLGVSVSPHRDPNCSCFTLSCVKIYSSRIDSFEGKVQMLNKIENGTLHCIYLFREKKKVNMFLNAFQLLENWTAELWSLKKELEESSLNLKDFCCHLYMKFPSLFCHKRSLGKFSRKFSTYKADS